MLILNLMTERKFPELIIKIALSVLNIFCKYLNVLFCLIHIFCHHFITIKLIKLFFCATGYGGNVVRESVKAHAPWFIMDFKDLEAAL